MKIQVNTDKNIAGSARQESYVEEKVNNALKHYVDKVSRVEVHMSDQNADKEGSDDIQCRIELRVKGLSPVLVESRDETQDKALSGALSKAKARLRTIIGKMKD